MYNFKKKLPLYIKNEIELFDEKLSSYSDITKINYERSLIDYLIWYKKIPKKNEPVIENTKKYKLFLKEKKKNTNSSINFKMVGILKYYKLILEKEDEIEQMKNENYCKPKKANDHKLIKKFMVKVYSNGFVEIDK